MKKRKAGSTAKRANGSLDQISDDVIPHLRPHARCTSDSLRELDVDIREALSKELHDLLNSLWPAAVWIELAMSEESCPPKFIETLKRLKPCIEEAMTIALRAGELIDSPLSVRSHS